MKNKFVKDQKVRHKETKVVLEIDHYEVKNMESLPPQIIVVCKWIDAVSQRYFFGEFKEDDLEFYDV